MPHVKQSLKIKASRELLDHLHASWETVGVNGFLGGAAEVYDAAGQSMGTLVYVAYIPLKSITDQSPKNATDPFRPSNSPYGHGTGI